MRVALDRRLANGDKTAIHVALDGGFDGVDVGIARFVLQQTPFLFKREEAAACDMEVGILALDRVVYVIAPLGPGKKAYPRLFSKETVHELGVSVERDGLAAHRIETLAKSGIAVRYSFKEALRHVVSMYVMECFHSGKGRTVLLAQGFMMVQPGPEIWPGMMLVAGKPS